MSFDTSTCIKWYRWKATCVRGIQGKEDDIVHDSDATHNTSIIEIITYILIFAM